MLRVALLIEVVEFAEFSKRISVVIRRRFASQILLERQNWNPTSSQIGGTLLRDNTGSASGIAGCTREIF